MKELIIIKLGGGLIAPKDWKSNTANIKVIRRLAEEIYKFAKTNSTATAIVIVAGSGNFGHHAVRKYNQDTPLGASLIQFAAAQIAYIVAKIFLAKQIAVSVFSPHALGSIKPVIAALKKDQIPLLHGDLVINEDAQVHSGEMVIADLVKEFRKKKIEVKRIIQLSREDGVLDTGGQVIKKIDARNFKRLQKAIGGSTADVTGGMLHKVEQSLEIARKYKIDTYIANGAKKGVLSGLLRGMKVKATRITN